MSKGKKKIKEIAEQYISGKELSLLIEGLDEVIPLTTTDKKSNQVSVLTKEVLLLLLDKNTQSETKQEWLRERNLTLEAKNRTLRMRLNEETTASSVKKPLSLKKLFIEEMGCRRGL